MTVSALCLATAGALLLFAPDETIGMLAPGSGPPILVQLLGAGVILGAGLAGFVMYLVGRRTG